MNKDWEILGKLIGNKSIALKLSNRYSSVRKALAEDENKLLLIKGVGKSTVSKLKNILELTKIIYTKRLDKNSPISMPQDVFFMFGEELRDCKEEHFLVLTLDIKNKIINKYLISIGLVDASLVHPREIFRKAISDNASNIILAHNHPSGDPLPSNEDINATKRIVEAGKIIGIGVLDHIIIGDGDFCSLKNKNLI